METKGYKHFIEGERIYLREVRPSDVNERYYRWMNDSEVAQYLETRFYPQSMEKIARYVDDMDNSEDNVFLAIIDRDSKEHIGNIKLGPINWIHRFADVSIIIGEKKYWGKGYGSEIIRLVVEYAFHTLNLRRLTAGIYANNVGSVKAFLKAGFKQEGVLGKHRHYNGQYIDEKIFGIVR